MIKSLEWVADKLRIVDQTQIPNRLIYKDLRKIEEVYEAIEKLQLRGAPAIGVAAGYGLYLGLRGKKIAGKNDFLAETKSLARYLSGARPTAVNLKWALQYVIEKIERVAGGPDELLHKILHLANQIQFDDEMRCKKIGGYGSELIQDGMTILTHCNTGALATAGMGTAFAAILTAFQQGKNIQVLVDETRPLLQGARLTMWELQQAGIPAILIADNMAAYAMQQGKVNLVIVGADRIAANGDVANKIGSYSLAVNCQYHQIPFYVAAPLSTFDPSAASGEQIPIEERDCREITHIWEKLTITVADANCWNPAFDITPAGLVTGIITEAGIVYQPFEETLNHLNNEVYQNQEELNL